MKNVFALGLLVVVLFCLVDEGQSLCHYCAYAPLCDRCEFDFPLVFSFSFLSFIFYLFFFFFSFSFLFLMDIFLLTLF